jgi:predicted outer membrane repeat protein
VVPAGRYVLALGGFDEDEGATGDLDIASELAILGDGASVTTISANGIDRVFHLQDNAKLSLFGVTARDGRVDSSMASQKGGGILSDSETAALTIEGCTITSNYADEYGGGIFATSLTLVDSDVTWNTSGTSKGGGIELASNAMPSLIRGSMIANNSATDGGGIRNRGDLLIEASTIAHNSASMRGGACTPNGARA